MRKVIIYSAAALLIAGSVGIASAQQTRIPQTSGFGTGVGESGGTGSRSQIWDTEAMIERLEQPETVFGKLFGKDIPGRKIYLQTAAEGVTSHDQGRAGANTATTQTVYLDDKSNMQQLDTVNEGDYVAVSVREETTEAQPFGTGRKLLRDIQVIRGKETLAGFGGLGQRPDPATEAGIVTNSGGYAGAIVGEVLPGAISGEKGIKSEVGTYTGAAPCWNCEPQPGWGYGDTSQSDYGSSTNPNFSKK